MRLRLFALLSGFSLSLAAQPAAAPKAPEPFAFADFTWLNGNSRQKEALLDSKYFTGEFRLDVNVIHDFNHPRDHTLVGSTEAGRTEEVQVQHLGFGGDFHWENVHARLMTQFGAASQLTPNNDPSPARGQGRLNEAYRYLAEAYGGYHWDTWNGINLDAGIFMSYVGLASYYAADNWTYQPSFVSGNTPWFFNGIRLQAHPSERLKLELWLVNGWQAYGMFNDAPGLGASVTWRPSGNVSLTSNNYWGRDTLGNRDRVRLHTDNSLQVKYLDRPGAALDKAAFSLTLDAGEERGGGVSPSPNAPKQYFLGFMVYNRLWFAGDRHALTLGGGAINNPGRYLVILPAINGATAASGTPYFTTNPGDVYRAWDVSLTYDYMPNPFLTWRSEFEHRAANVPYFSGAGGITPPGGNQGAPGSLVSGWSPDLRRTENRLNLALLVKF